MSAILAPSPFSKAIPQGHPPSSGLISPPGQVLESTPVPVRTLEAKAASPETQDMVSSNSAQQYHGLHCTMGVVWNPSPTLPWVMPQYPWKDIIFFGHKRAPPVQKEKCIYSEVLCLLEFTSGLKSLNSKNHGWYNNHNLYSSSRTSSRS